MQTGTDSGKSGMRASLGQITASESWKHQRNAEETKPKYNQDATFYLFVIVLTSLCLFFLCHITNSVIADINISKLRLKQDLWPQGRFLQDPWRLSCWVWTTDVWRQADLCQRVSTSSFISPEQTASGHHAKSTAEGESAAPRLADEPTQCGIQKHNVRKFLNFLKV